MLNSEREEQEWLINGRRISITHQTIKSAQLFLRYLVIITIILLGYANHLQAKDIEYAHRILQQYSNFDPKSYSLSISAILSNYTMRLNIFQKQMQILKKQIRLDLLNEKESINQILSNSSRIIQQLDQSIGALQQVQRSRQFLSRKQTTDNIIQSNLTIDSFGEDYQNYTNQFYLTLNNIQQPYYDIQSNLNHTQQMNYLLQNQYQNYQHKYNIDQYSYEISMCVVVPTRNNIQDHRYIYNLQSILNQNYTNYKIVIVDDHSDDQTGILIQRYLRRQKIPSNKAVVIFNQRRQGSLANLYYAVHNHCQNYTVTLQVDGDDQLIGKYVFKLFNAVYQAKNPGFAYSNHIYYAKNEGYISKGYSEAYTKLSIQKQNYRKIIQKFGHLRSFRTQLFFKIKDQDLRDAKGQFYMAAGDEAYIFPILEMSCRNIEFIDEPTYLYNGGTGSNIRKAFKKNQQQNAIHIRLLKKYSCLHVYENPLISI